MIYRRRKSMDLVKIIMAYMEKRAIGNKYKQECTIGISKTTLNKAQMFRNKSEKILKYNG